MWLVVIFGTVAVLLFWAAQSQASVSGIDTIIPAGSLTGDPTMVFPGMITIEQLAQAIAKAEGYYQPGSLPARIHNPGDLKLGDRGLGTDGGKTIFATDQQGWDALYHELNLIMTGQSAFYTPQMSIRELALVWTGNDNPAGWASTVAAELGVSVSSPLQDVMA